MAARIGHRGDEMREFYNKHKEKIELVIVGVLMVLLVIFVFMFRAYFNIPWWA
jgi:hypothetical protein